jgi:hypothetical protein
MDQVIIVDGGIEHIPCGPSIMEVSAPIYCGNGYIEDVDTLIWDCGAILSERLPDRDLLTGEIDRTSTGGVNLVRVVYLTQAIWINPLRQV